MIILFCLFVFMLQVVNKILTVAFRFVLFFFCSTNIQQEKCIFPAYSYKILFSPKSEFEVQVDDNENW